MKLAVNIGFIFLVSLVGFLTKAGEFTSEQRTVNHQVATAHQDLSDSHSRVSILFDDSDRQELLYVENVEEDEDDKSYKKCCDPIFNEVIGRSLETSTNDVCYLHKRLIPGLNYTPQYHSCIYMLHEVFRL